MSSCVAHCFKAGHPATSLGADLSVPPLLSSSLQTSKSCRKGNVKAFGSKPISILYPHINRIILGDELEQN